MILKDEYIYLRKGRSDRHDLMENIEAVAVFPDHSGYAPHLPFNAGKSQKWVVSPGVV